MNIGPLDRRLQIQEQVSTQSSTSGRPVIQWLTTATVWANIQDQMPSKSESVIAGAKEVGLNRVRIRMRWQAGVTSASRFKVALPEERIFQIIGGPAEIGGRRVALEFMCEEVTA